jgi:hypothetical protein
VCRLSAPQYHGQNKLVESHSMLMVAQARGWTVTYSTGCNICDTRPPGYPNQPCGISALRQHKPPPAPDTSGIAEAVAVAKDADVAVLFLGSDQYVILAVNPAMFLLRFVLSCHCVKCNVCACPYARIGRTTEAENFDRVSLGLVGAQEQLLAAVSAVQQNVVLVLVHGGPIDVSTAERSPCARRFHL